MVGQSSGGAGYRDHKVSCDEGGADKRQDRQDDGAGARRIGGGSGLDERWKLDGQRWRMKLGNLDKRRLKKKRRWV